MDYDWTNTVHSIGSAYIGSYTSITKYHSTVVECYSVECERSKYPQGPRLKIALGPAAGSCVI
jgi:hypothetical protein